MFYRVILPVPAVALNCSEPGRDYRDTFHHPSSPLAWWHNQVYRWRHQVWPRESCEGWCRLTCSLYHHCCWCCLALWPLQWRWLIIRTTAVINRSSLCVSKRETWPIIMLDYSIISADGKRRRKRHINNHCKTLHSHTQSEMMRNQPMYSTCRLPSVTVQ